jgi:secreted Zn-dependent insulinase-like peptidase
MSRELNTSPLKYFAHLFGHEGKNSVLSYLKKEGLA